MPLCSASRFPAASESSIPLKLLFVAPMKLHMLTDTIALAFMITPSDADNWVQIALRGSNLLHRNKNRYPPTTMILRSTSIHGG